MNKRHYEHTLPNIRGSLSNTYYLSLMYHLCITGFLKVIVEVLQYKYVLINRSVCIASGHPGVRSGNIRV